jgi:hypothetical protein
MQSDHDRKFHLDLDQRRAVRLLPKIEERVQLLARSLLHFSAKRRRLANYHAAGPGLREGAPQCPASSKAVRQVPDFRVCTQDHRSRPTVICRSSNALQRYRVSEHHTVGFYSGASTLLPPKAVSLSICRAQNCFHCTHDERLTILNAIISELFCIPDQSVCVKRGIAALPIMKATQPHRDFFCSCNFVTRELSTRQL